MSGLSYADCFARKPKQHSFENMEEDKVIALLHQVNGCTPNPTLLADLKLKGKCY